MTPGDKNSLEHIATNSSSKEQISEIKKTPDVMQQAKETLMRTRQSLEALQSRIATGYKAEEVESKVTTLLTSMENIDAVDTGLVRSVIDGMKDKTIDAKQSLEKTIALLHDIEVKSEKLSQADLEKIVDTKTGIASTQSQLDALEHTVTLDEALHKTEEKAFAAVQSELKSKWRCPNWLADKIHDYLTIKYIQKKEVEGFRGKAGGVVTGLLGFALGAKWKTFFGALESGNGDALRGALNNFDFVKDKLDGIKEQRKENSSDLKKAAVEKTKEMTEGEIEQQKNAFKRWMKKFVKRHFNKDVDDTVLARVIEKVQFSTVLKDGTENIQEIYMFCKTHGKEGQDANIADGTFDALTLGPVLTYRMLKALAEEGVVSGGEMAWSVTGDILHYGVKGFQLFGSGMDVVLGNIPLSKVGERVAGLYEKTPDVAQELLFAYMYRTANSPLFKVMANIGHVATKSLLYMAVDLGDDVDGIKNIREAYRGQLTTALNEFKEFSTIVKGANLPAMQGLQTLVTKYQSSFDSIVGELDNSQSIMTEFKTHTASGRDKTKLIKDLKQKGLLGNPTLEADLLQSIDATDFRVKLASHMEGVLTKNVSSIRNVDMIERLGQQGMRFAGGEKAVFSMLYDAHHELEKTTKAWTKAVNQKGRFSDIKAKRYETKLGYLTGYQMKEVAGRPAFYFKNAQSFGDFAEKLKYLAKQSPDAAKFLIGKSPLFLVAGMEFSKEGALSDKLLGLSALVPLVGPFMIFKDGAGLAQMDASKMVLGGVLFGYDTYHIIKVAAGEGLTGVAKYIAQPVVDVYEVLRFAREGALKGRVIIGDAIRLGRAEGVARLGESMRNFLRTEGRLGRLGLTALVVGGVGFGIHKLTSNDGIDAETMAMVEKYKDKPELLDKDIAKQRPTLAQSDRNDYLRAAVLRLGGFSPEQITEITVDYDESKKEYACTLPSVIHKDSVDTLKARLAGAVSQLDAGSTVRTFFHERALVQFRDMLAGEYGQQSGNESGTAKQAYVEAMGYAADQAKTIIG